MLPSSARLRRAPEFRTVVRSGIRVGRTTLVLHATPGKTEGSRAGFVVSKAVGGAVVRNRVKRRLRALVREQVTGSDLVLDVVVRALPAAATEPERLAADFCSAWATAARRVAA